MGGLYISTRADATPCVAAWMCSGMLSRFGPGTLWSTTAQSAGITSWTSVSPCRSVCPPIRARGRPHTWYHSGITLGATHQAVFTGQRALEGGQSMRTNAIGALSRCLHSLSRRAACRVGWPCSHAHSGPLAVSSRPPQSPTQASSARRTRHRRRVKSARSLGGSAT